MLSNFVENDRVMEMEEFKITKYVDLLSDVGFKTVFANEENKTVIINFINRLLQGERVVKSIEFASNEVFGKVYDGKGVRFDLHCVDQDGTRFIVEMQKARHDRDFYQRSVYYGTRAYELQFVVYLCSWGLFKKTKEECKDLMDQWCYCLKNAIFQRI